MLNKYFIGQSVLKTLGNLMYNYSKIFLKDSVFINCSKITYNKDNKLTKLIQPSSICNRYCVYNIDIENLKYNIM